MLCHLVLFSCMDLSSLMTVVNWCAGFSMQIAQNNLHELWALLNFLLPEIFSSAETFDEWFQISGENDQQEVVQQLHKVKLCIISTISLGYAIRYNLQAEVMKIRPTTCVRACSRHDSYILKFWQPVENNYSLTFQFLLLIRSFDHSFLGDWSLMLRKDCLQRRKQFLRLVCLRCRNTTIGLCCRKILRLLIQEESASVFLI